MEISTGGLYFISDEFFRKVNDSFLKINYEHTKRPHYFALFDEETGLYWMVPCSSKVEKFERIIKERRIKGKRTNSIKIVSIFNKKSVLLFQDMFPIAKKYILNQYIKNGKFVRIANVKLIQKLERNGKAIIRLLRMGVKFTPTSPDVLRIERIMLDELRFNH